MNKYRVTIEKYVKETQEFPIKTQYIIPSPDMESVFGIVEDGNYIFDCLAWEIVKIEKE